MAGPRGTSRESSEPIGSRERDPLVRELDIGRGPLTGMGSTPPIRGLIEAVPADQWNWRDRKWVLEVVKRSESTHYVYASESDPHLSYAWRRPFPKRFIKPFSDLVEDRVAVFGIALTPHGVDLAEEADAAHRALARKVDQVLDIGFELVLIRFDQQHEPVDTATQVELVNTLWDHVEGRAEVVVVPRDIHQMWSTPELDDLSTGLAPDVLIAWGGPDPSPREITASMVEARREATGGRAPLVWDDLGMNFGTRADRLQIGPYTGRQPEALAASSGWLRSTPTVARTTVPQLLTYSAWLGGRDPQAALEEEGGDLTPFMEGCDGRVPFEHATTAVEALTTPDWIDAVSAAVRWFRAAKVAETPHLGSQVRRWRTHLHEEADLCLHVLRALQLQQPVARLDGDGSGVAAAPGNDQVFAAAVLLASIWKTMRAKATTVMGERFTFDSRVTLGRSGTHRANGPLVLEGRNATDVLARALFERLADLPDVDPDLVVECDGTQIPVGADGAFSAPPGRPVLVSWGPCRTMVRPGQALPIEDDQRFGTAPQFHL